MTEKGNNKAMDRQKRSKDQPGSPQSAEMETDGCEGVSECLALDGEGPGFDTYRNFISEFIDVVVEMDTDGVITNSSPGVEDHFGFDPDQLRGKKILDITHPDDRDKARDLIEHVHRLGTFSRIVFRLVHKDGHPVPVVGTSRLLERNDEIRHLAILMDMTVQKSIQKALEDSEEKYRNLIDGSVYGHFIMNMDDHFTYWNRSAGDITGYDYRPGHSMNYKDIVVEEDWERADSDFNKLAMGKKFRNPMVYRIMRKDGEKRYVEVDAIPIFEEGQLTGFQGTVVDITDRKTAELSLNEKLDDLEHINKAAFKAESEKGLPGVYRILCQGLLDMTGAMATAISEFDPQNNILTIKHISTDKKTGMKVKEIVGIDLVGLQHHFDPRKLKISSTAKINLVDGWKDIFFGSITKQKAKRIAKATGSGDMIGVVLSSGKQMMGTMAIVMPGDRPFHKFDTVETYVNLAAAILQSKMDEEALIRAQAKLETRVNERTAELSRTNQVLQMEIERRRVTQEALADSEKKYRDLVENALEGIAVVQDDRIKFINKQLRKLLSMPKKKILGQNFIELIHNDDIKKIASRRKERDKGHWLPPNITCRIKTGKKQTKWIDASTVWIEWEGRPASLHFINDVTERKQVLDALAQSEMKFRQVFHGSNDAILINEFGQDMEMRPFVEVNDTACKIIGYSRKELLTMTVFDLDNKLDQKDVDRISEILEKSGQTTIETEVMRKDKTTIPLEINLNVFTMNGKPHLMTHARDITLKKRMEEEMLRSKKLESLGMLAGGIAHDFNNILTSILGNISFAKSSIDVNDRMYKRLDEAEKASMHAKGLTQELLTFSKGGIPVKSVIPVQDIIKDSCDMILSGCRSDCVSDIAEDTWAANLDRGQIVQVLNNILINADQAMPEGGLIRVSAGNVHIKGDQGLPLDSGKYIKITITDSGIGIKKEHLSSVFDPYFTTKKGGSGLGLAICYTIVKNHNGHIALESDPGSGTRVHVYLPAVIERPHEKKLGKSKISRKRRGRILVMDDEKIIRDVVSDMLTDIGYDVVTALEGREVLDIYQKALEEGNPFDAMIMDLTVPEGMGGMETMERLLKLDPDARAVVSSGYSNDAIMSDYKKYGFKAVLAKPYGFEQLCKTLEEVLEGNGDGGKTKGK